MNRIYPSISIEALLEDFPDAAGELVKRGLPCLVCGEPLWGTLEELARDKGWTDSQIAALAEELNEAVAQERNL